MSLDPRVAATLDWLRTHGTERNREGMARYGIRSPKVFGVSMTTMRPLARSLGRDHELALALWETGWLEARLLAAFIADPAQVTATQMDRWARDFDNWALCDSTCLHCFSAAPAAWSRVRAWSGRRGEFVRRAAFALLAALATRDKRAPDERFLAMLPLVERAAADERDIVKKGVSWALRGIGKRDAALNAEAVALADRLRTSPSPAARWIGRDAYRELTSTAVRARLVRRSPPRARSAPGPRAPSSARSRR